MKRWQVILTTISILSLITAAGYLGWQSGPTQASQAPLKPVTVAVTRGTVQQTVTAPGQVVGTRDVLLSLKVAGQVAEVNVRPGSIVSAGAVLARLDTEPLIEALELAQRELALAQRDHERQRVEAELALSNAEAKLKQAQIRQPSQNAVQAELMAAQAELRQILDGPSEDEISVAAAELLQSEVELKQAQWAYDQIAYADTIGSSPEAADLERATLDYEAKLAAYNLATQSADEAEIANAEANVQQAQAAVAAAQAEIEAGQQELHILTNEVEQARLTLEALETGVDPALMKALKRAERDLANATLTAPLDGIILEVRIKPGEQVTSETGLILLADPTAVEVQTKVIEEDVPLIQIGQAVELFFDAQPIDAVPGCVARIVPQRIQGEDRPLYHVYITPERPPVGIFAGMSADASIIIAQRADVLRLPRALVQARSDGSAVVEVWQNGQPSRREVKVGLRGDVYAEIVAGLAEGMEVVGE